jgi:hypothetical protein
MIAPKWTTANFDTHFSPQVTLATVSWQKKRAIMLHFKHLKSGFFHSGRYELLSDFRKKKKNLLSDDSTVKVDLQFTSIFLRRVSASESWAHGHHHRCLWLPMFFLPKCKETQQHQNDKNHARSWNLNFEFFCRGSMRRQWGLTPMSPNSAGSILVLTFQLF